MVSNRRIMWLCWIWSTSTITSTSSTTSAYSSPSRVAADRQQRLVYINGSNNKGSWNRLRGGAAAANSVLPGGTTSPTATTRPSASTSSLTTTALPMALQQTPQSAPNTTATATTAATRKSVATLQKLERIDYNATSTDAGSLSMDQLVLALCIDPAALEQHRGLTETQVAARSAQYGPNALRAKPRTSVWLLIAEQFQDRLVQILLAVAVLSAVFGVLQHNGGTAAAVESESILKALVEPSVILAILVLNAATGVWQSMSANDSLVALQKMQADVCRVARNDKLLEIPAAELVPGDVLLVQVGDKIAADARLLSLEQSLSLKVDQGSLTGESVTVGKLPGDDGTVAANSPVQDQKGMLFAGTMVTAGRGKAVVVQTGMDTQFGKIQAGVTEAAATQVKTPLAIKLDDFGEQLTLIIGVICLAVWIVSIPKMNDPSFANVWQGGIYYAKVAVALGVAAIPEGLPAVITLCLSLGTRRMAERNVIVRKLPSVETLGCVTVICTDKTGTLTQNEMTAVSLIMFEHDSNVANKTIDPAAIVVEHPVEGISYSPVGKVMGIAYNTEVKDHPLGSVADIAAVAALCNDAKIIGNNDIDKEQEEAEVDGAGSVVKHDSTQQSALKKKSKRKKLNGDTKKTYERVGEPTEAALCVLAEKLGGMSHYLDGGQFDSKGLHFNVPPSVLASANVMGWRQVHPRLATLEFNRDRKSMSVLCDFPKGDYPSAEDFHEGARSRKSGNRLLVKGAPNLLFERCTHVKFRDGTVAKMTGPIRRSIEKKVSEMAARPLRCLALAVKDSDELEPSLKEFAPKEDGDIAKHPLLSDPSTYKNIESGLTLLGIVGIKDPARPEVADSIIQCTQAGIRVLMITGDAKDTAVAIARDVNIFPRQPQDDVKPIKAFEGREFFQKPIREQLEILAEDNIVFCRAEPVDKQRLVQMLQSLGEIPAMTGDGVNDAPALQQAAIGIAMGITGTEVSKEAADMILADDNFFTIVAAVEEGRSIFDNMQAFICFLISCNIGEICAIFFATLAGFPEPLTAMHLLWVNLVTDGPPATALGFNPPASDLMQRPPRPTDEPIMTKWLLTRYCVTGLYVGLATIGVYAGHYVSEGITLAQLASWSQCGEFWSPADGVLCSDLFQGSGRMLPQTLALTTLVCMEMLKALSAVSVDSSIFRVGPQDNPWLLLGVSGPLLLHLFVLYSSKLGLPALGESFGMVPLSTENWVTVLTWAAPILIVDEILKAIGRRINQEDRNSEKGVKAVL